MTLPVTLGVPLGVSLEILATHIPLPVKIRTELPDRIEVEHEPERASDVEYVDRICREVQRGDPGRDEPFGRASAVSGVRVKERSDADHERAGLAVFALRE